MSFAENFHTFWSLGIWRHKITETLTWAVVSNLAIQFKDKPRLVYNQWKNVTQDKYATKNASNTRGSSLSWFHLI